MSKVLPLVREVEQKIMKKLDKPKNKRGTWHDVSNISISILLRPQFKLSECDKKTNTLNSFRG
jgi:hypothetical protein